MKLPDGVAEVLLGAALHSVILVVVESVAASGLVALALYGLTYVITWDDQTEHAIVVALSLLTFLGVLILLLSMRRRRVVMDVPKSEWTYDSRKISIDYSDIDHPVYKRRYMVRSHSDGLEKITDSFCWTGDAGGLPICTLGDCQIRESGHSGLFTLFEVVFPSKLKRGKTKEIELVWNLSNSERLAKPFISTTISHKTSRMEFEVILHPGTYRSPAYYTTSPHVHTQYSNEIEEMNFTGDRVYISKGTPPKIFSHHEVRWRWL